MSKKEWTAAALIMGLVIVLQIPGHDAVDMEGMNHAAEGSHAQAPATPDAASPLHAVTLDVTGMT